MTETKTATRMAEMARTKTMMEIAIIKTKVYENVHSDTSSGYHCGNNYDGWKQETTKITSIVTLLANGVLTHLLHGMLEMI